MNAQEPILRTYAKEFAELYRDAPAMVFFSSRRLRPDGLPDWVRDLGIRVLSVFPDDGQWVVTEIRSGRPSAHGKALASISSPFSSIWMIGALDEDAFAAACRLTPVLSADSSLEVRRLSSADDPAIAADLLKCCLADRAEFMVRNHGLLLEISALRKYFETMVRIPAEVTEALHNLRLSGLRQVFSNEHVVPAVISKAAAPLSSVALTAEGLRQLLPVHARGLAGIDLHLSSVGAGGAGAVLASLEATDAVEVMASWKIQVSDLREGWIALRLEAPSPLMHRQLVLSLRLQGRASIHLSARPASPFPEYALQPATADTPDVGESPAAPIMLKLRAWGGLPGVISPSHAVPPPFQLPVPRRAILSAEMSRPPSTSESFALLPAGGIRVRGAPGRPTGVRLRISVSAEVWAIGCRAQLFNVPAGEPIMCRLVAAAPDTDFDDVLMVRGVLGASEWTVLKNGGGDQVLLLNLPPLGETAIDLHALLLLDEAPLVARAAADFNHFFVEVQAGHGESRRDYWPTDGSGENLNDGREDEPSISHR